MSGQSILISGCTGYLGSNLAEKLISLGYRVIGLVRSCSVMKRVSKIEALELCNIEIEDLRLLIKKYDIKVVLHLATSYGKKGEPLSYLLNSNLIFPIELLEASIDSGVQYFINTDTALSDNVSFYSLSKRQFKEWLKLHSKDIKIINLVSEYFYGPGDDEWKLITMILRSLINEKEFIDFTLGEQKRDFIYISDVVNAYITILQNLNTMNNWQEYSVCTGERFSIRRLASICKEITGNTTTTLRFGVLPERISDYDETFLDNSKLLELGWGAKVDLFSGITTIVDDLRNENEIILNAEKY